MCSTISGSPWSDAEYTVFLQAQAGLPSSLPGRDTPQQQVPQDVFTLVGWRRADRRRERVEHHRLEHDSGDALQVEAGSELARGLGLGEQATEELDDRRERMRRFPRMR